jgi:hypothetical protein
MAWSFTFMPPMSCHGMVLSHRCTLTYNHKNFGSSDIFEFMANSAEIALLFCLYLKAGTKGLNFFLWPFQLF